MNRSSTVRLCRTITAILLASMSIALTAASIQAARALRPSGSDTLTLALANGASFVYAGQSGTPAPRFTATLVLAAPPTGNYFMQVGVTVDGKTVGNGNPPTQNGLTYTFTIDSTGIIIPSGSQTAVASFYNASTHTTDQSNSVAFTITQATPQLQCQFNGNVSFVNDPGQTLQVRMSFDNENPNAPVDWQNATYQITFIDSANNTSSSGTLTPDSQDVVTIQAPPRYDWYYLLCTFNGTANFATTTSQASKPYFLVSAKHPLGKIDFTSVPWPLVAYKTAQVHIVVHGTSGGPVPNGYVSMRIGYIYTPYTKLDANGELAGTLGALGPGNLGGNVVLYVDYQGDPYYDENFTSGFSMPSAPTSTPTSGGSGGGLVPTATASLSPTATTATAAAGGVLLTPTASGTTSPVVYASSTPWYQTGGMFWWVLLAALVVGGSGGGVFFWRRRPKPAVLKAAPPGLAAPEAGEAPPPNASPPNASPPNAGPPN